MKRMVPIALRKVLEELMKGNERQFKVESEKDVLVVFKEKDESSNFYFKVESLHVANEKSTYTISFNPSSEEHLNARRYGGVSLLTLRNEFTKWKNLVEQCNEDSPLFDDSISQSYYDELAPEFIMDSDADLNPFPIKQQERIMLFLDYAGTVFSERTEEDDDAKEAMRLVEEAKMNLSKSTKREVVNSVRKVIAKAFKVGLEIGQKLLVEFTTELSKKLIMGVGT